MALWVTRNSPKVKNFQQEGPRGKPKVAHLYICPPNPPPPSSATQSGNPAATRSDFKRCVTTSTCTFCCFLCFLTQTAQSGDELMTLTTAVETTAIDPLCLTNLHRERHLVPRSDFSPFPPVHRRARDMKCSKILILSTFVSKDVSDSDSLLELLSLTWSCCHGSRSDQKLSETAHLKGKT